MCHLVGSFRSKRSLEEILGSLGYSTHSPKLLIMKRFSFSLALSLFCIASVFAQKNTIKGDGPVVTKELKLDQFDGIGLGLVATVHVYKGPQKVTIDAQQNIIDNLNMEIEKDGTWGIGGKDRVNFKNYKDIVINITIPTLDELSIGGSGAIIAHDAFTGIKHLELNIGGSGKIEMVGSAKKVAINIAGSGTVEAKRLNAQQCEVNIAGSGDALIDVADDLEVSIAGSGDVRYSGHPRVKSSIAGSGRVQTMN